MSPILHLEEYQTLTLSFPLGWKTLGLACGSLYFLLSTLFVSFIALYISELYLFLNNSILLQGQGNTLPLCHHWHNTEHILSIPQFTFQLNYQRHNSLTPFMIIFSLSVGSSFKNHQFPTYVPGGQCFIATSMTSSLFLSTFLQKLLHLPGSLLTFLEQANWYSPIKC